MYCGRNVEWKSKTRSICCCFIRIVFAAKTLYTESYSSFDTCSKSGRKGNNGRVVELVDDAVEVDRHRRRRDKSLIYAIIVVIIGNTKIKNRKIVMNFNIIGLLLQ